MEKKDVLIVGAGPVGLVMAIELARYGVGVRLIDKAAQRSDKSKALVIWSRSLELLERSGCSVGLVDAGYKVITLNISADGKSIAQMTLEGLATPYPYALMIPQSETERILEEFLNTLGVRVERTVELTRFDASDDEVVSVLHHSDGTEETVESSWLIGCDGAHSTVRHQLGMEFEGETSPIEWLLADVHLEGIPRAPEINVVWHADGIVVTFPIAEDRYRVIADAGAAIEKSAPHSEPTLEDGYRSVADSGAATDTTALQSEPTLEQVQAILDKRFPGGVRATNPIWLSSFRINERKVTDYRAGRVFLAGDAAHVHSPAGGQGMNTGMQDACNLAWKLALVVHGTCGAQLLDSYSSERSPIADEVLKVTGRVTSLGTVKGKAAQFLRNHTAALVLGLPIVRRLAAESAAEISIGYPHSPLNAAGSYRDPAPGTRAPLRPTEASVGAGGTPRFVLFADPDGMPAKLQESYADLLEPILREPFHPGGIWLVRPDGYIALSAKAGDWKAVIAYLTRLRLWTN
jgi:2-polyprenyl-6-methoxyphenol hydroxylase-like FAD-dependent oxidoreductase